jgi:hypothetical protein
MNYQQNPDRKKTSVTVKLEGVAYSYGVKKNKQNGDWGITINDLLLKLKYLEEKMVSGHLRPASPSIGIIVNKIQA